MELVSIENSQVITLFIAGQSTGRPSIPRVLKLVAERYAFVGYPTEIKDIGGDSVKFREGVFQGKGIESFDIHRDGVVVVAKTNTSLIDAFVDDVSVWMEAEFGLMRVETHKISKNYESHIVVRSKAPLLRALDVMSAVGEAVSKSIKKSTKLEVAYESAALALGVDHTIVPGMKPVGFRIERKAGASFTSNLYYSAAPLPTDEHLKILDTFEKSF